MARVTPSRRDPRCSSASRGRSRLSEEAAFEEVHRQGRALREMLRTESQASYGCCNVGNSSVSSSIRGSGRTSGGLQSGSSSRKTSPAHPTRTPAQFDGSSSLRRPSPPATVRRLNEALEAVAACKEQALAPPVSAKRPGLVEVQQRGREIRELLRRNPHAVVGASESAAKPHRLRPPAGFATPLRKHTPRWGTPMKASGKQVGIGSSDSTGSARSADASTATPSLGSARSLRSVPISSPEASARSKSLASVTTPPASARLLSARSARPPKAWSLEAAAPPPSSSRPPQAANPPVAVEFKPIIDSFDTAGCQTSAPRTPVRLAEAARCGNVEAIRECLAEGETVGTRDQDGWLPLHYAAAEGHLEACRALLEARGDANAVLPDFSTPLMLAAEEAHISVAQLLLQSGARHQCRDEAGFTAMERCASSALEELTCCVQMVM